MLSEYDRKVLSMCAEAARALADRCEETARGELSTGELADLVELFGAKLPDVARNVHRRAGGST